LRQAMAMVDHARRRRDAEALPVPSAPVALPS
jgi:hypothetical protein